MKANLTELNTSEQTKKTMFYQKHKKQVQLQYLENYFLSLGYQCK